MKHLYVYLAWNVITFLLIGLDKYKSVHNKRRISEASLLESAFIMGAVGCIFGALIFHHKTKKLKFQILFPMALVFNLGVYILLNYYFGASF